MPDIFALSKYFGNAPVLDYFEEQHDRAGHMFALDMCEHESCREAARRSQSVLRRKDSLWYCKEAIARHDSRSPIDWLNPVRHVNRATQRILPPLPRDEHGRFEKRV